MSHKQLTLRKEHCAQQSFEFHLCELRRDIEMGVPVRHLWVRVELLEELVEKTGGSLVTEHYRLGLCEVKKLVVLRDERQRQNRRRARLEAVR